MRSPSVKINKSGNGSGTVTSSPAGIYCGSDCEEAFPDGTVVTLTAVPNEGSAFTGWSGGGCSGTGQCQVTVNGAVTVTATFSRLYSLTIYKSGSGTGRITSVPPGIDCRFDQTGGCSAYYAQGSSVILTATPDAGSSFAGWSGGGCSGKGACTVTVSSNSSVTATFTPPCAYTLTSLSKTLNFRGGLISITVKANQSICGPPDVASGAQWIQIASGTWKNGQGVVKFTVNPTDRSLARLCTLFIGGQEFAVNQTGVVCAITKTVPTSSPLFTASGGSTTFDVYLNAIDCAWTASTPVSWIVLGTPGGSGTGTVSYSVTPNGDGKSEEQQDRGASVTDEEESLYGEAGQVTFVS